MSRLFRLIAITVCALLSLSASAAFAAGENRGAGEERGKPAAERDADTGQAAAHRDRRDDAARRGPRARSTAPRDDAAVKVVDREPNDHPSGRDRDDETTHQGGSMSDPDGMSNGGMDKPGHDGGYDDDRDYNNGCGNDDDFEDDNNGWCGRKRDRVRGGQAAKATDGAAPLGVTEESSAAEVAASEEVPSEVKGVTFTRENPAAPRQHSSHHTTAAEADRVQVQGTALQAEPPAVATRPAALARTGVELAVLALLGVCCLALGVAARRHRLTVPGR